MMDEASKDKLWQNYSKTHNADLRAYLRVCTVGQTSCWKNEYVLGV